MARARKATAPKSDFFERYKDLQGKKTEIQGWGGAAEAKDEIKKAAEAYKKESH